MKNTKHKHEKQKKTLKSPQCHFNKNLYKKDIMLGPVHGTRRQSGQRRQWLNNITDCIYRSNCQKLCTWQYIAYAVANSFIRSPTILAEYCKLDVFCASLCRFLILVLSPETTCKTGQMSIRPSVHPCSPNIFKP